MNKSLLYDRIKDSIMDPFFVGEVLPAECGGAPTCVVVDANKAFEQAFGLGLEQVLGKPLSLFLAPEAFIESVRSGFPAAVREYSGRAGLWLEGECRPLGESGLFSSRLRPAGEKLEGKYKALFNSIEEGFLLVEIRLAKSGGEPEIRYLEANEASVSLLGANLAGRNIGAVRSDDQGFWYDSFLQVAQTGERLNMSRYSSTYEKWFDFSLFRVEAPGSALVGCMFKDVTESRNLYNALRESEKRYRDLFENMSEGFFLAEVIRDGEGQAVDYRVLAVNRAHGRLTGRKPEDTVGRTGRELNGADAERRSGRFLRVAETGAPDHSAYYSPGLGRHFDVFAYCPRPGQFAVIFMDVTLQKQQENELAQQAYMLSCVREAIAATDRDHTIVYWNEMAEKLFGWTAEEAVGRPISDLMLTPAGTRLDLRKKLHEEGFFDGVIAYRGKGGMEFTIDLHARSFPGENGEFKGAIATFRDISKRVRTEETVRRQNEILRVINTVLQKAAVCSSLEELGQACLQVVEKATGSGMSLIGEISSDGLFRNIAISAMGWDQCKLPGYRAGAPYPSNFKLNGLCGSVIRTRRSILANEPAAHPTSLGVPDGHPKLDSFLGVPCMQDGAAVGMVAVANREGGYTNREQEFLEAVTPTILEVLQRKRAEVDRRLRDEELRATKDLLDDEVEALRWLHRISSRFIRHDRIQGIYEEILDAAMELTKADFGSMQLPAEGSGCLRIVAYRNFSEPFFRRFETVCGERTTCGRAFSERQRVIAEDLAADPALAGTPEAQAHLEEGIRCVQSTPMFSSTGSLIGVMSTHYRAAHSFNERELRLLDMLTRQAADVVERAVTEEAMAAQSHQLSQQAEELEQKNRLITDFFINISHEFKTPLTILMLGAELLENKARATGDAGLGMLKNLAVIKQNSYRLGRLVSNLLDITKLDAGFMEPRWEKADIVALVGSLVASTETFAAQKHLSLSFACEEEKWLVYTDPFMLERILLNLLSNAVKYTPSGGSVAVECSFSKSSYTLCVRDTGEGIPDDKKSIIFDRFRQVNTSLTRQSEGCGIGLALVKSLSELLGGTITFESRLGGGSVFTVKLPITDRETRRIAVDQSGMQMNKRVQMELSDIGISLE